MPVVTIARDTRAFAYQRCPPGFGAVTSTRDTELDESGLPPRSFLSALGCSRDRLAWSSQVHGGRILALAAPGAQGEGDAMVTNRLDLALAVRTADCAPVSIVDSRSGSFALVHAGWRSAALGIAGDAVRSLVALYGAVPGDLWVGIGPAISAAHYRVGHEVHAAFDAEFFTPDGDRWRFDLAGAIAADLERAGVAPANIERSEACTAGENHRYFSYRVEHTSSRLVSLVFARSVSNRS